MGAALYPKAQCLQIMADGGGSNGSRVRKALHGEVDLSHLLVAHFLSGGIDGVINFGFHSQTLRRLGRFNQVDNS
jgi:hypothetical protein